MDVLNDFYPLYPPNPETSSLSDSEISDNQNYLTELERIKRRIYYEQPLNNYEILMLDFCSQPHVTVMSDMQMCAEKLKDSSIKLCLKIE